MGDIDGGTGSTGSTGTTGGPVSPLRPVQTNDRLAVAVGCGVWAVLLVLSLVFSDRLADAGRGWWTWACLAGLLLGLGGLAFLQHRHTTGRDRV